MGKKIIAFIRGSSYCIQTLNNNKCEFKAYIKEQKRS